MSKRAFLLFLLMKIILIEGQYVLKVYNFEFEIEFIDSQLASQVISKFPLKVNKLKYNEGYLSHFFGKGHLRQMKKH